MTNSRHNGAKKNIFTSLISQVIVIICGIIVPRMMIGAFGSEAYGATTSIAQFLAYITLLEGGIGGVARAALYKPIAQNDTETISTILGEVSRFFRVIAWIFVAYVLLLACGFHSFSRITCMDRISTFILVVVISVSTLGQYFIGITHSIFLQADQKTYITNALSIGTTVLNAVCTVVLIRLHCSLIVVKLVSSLLFFMRPVVLYSYVTKYCSLKPQKKKSGKMYLTQKWTGLGQHIAYFLHSNTDIAILTILTDLRTVAVYSVYNMILSHMQSLAVSFSSGMEAVFGDMLARDEKKELHKTFRTYETVLSVVSIILFSVATVLIIPFIELYTEDITDVDYIQPLFALVMILTILSYCLRLPYHSLVIAAGHFKQTNTAAYGEAFLNIVLSFILVFRFGLVGVAVATLIATWYRFVYYVLYLSKNIFYRRTNLFLKRFMINATTYICNCIVGYAVASCFTLDSYLEWICCGVVLTTIIGGLTFGFNVLFFKNDCCVLVKKIIKK